MDRGFSTLIVTSWFAFVTFIESIIYLGAKAMQDSQRWIPLNSSFLVRIHGTLWSQVAQKSNAMLSQSKSSATDRTRLLWVLHAYYSNKRLLPVRAFKSIWEKSKFHTIICIASTISSTVVEKWYEIKVIHELNIWWKKQSAFIIVDNFDMFSYIIYII